MAGRRTNLALLLLTLVAFASGVLAFAFGTPFARWVVLAHGLLGLAIVVLVPWKSMVAGRGLRRRRSGRVISILLSVLVIIVIASGVGHASGLATSLGPISAMQLHVGSAVAGLALVGLHFWQRPVRPRISDLSRRTFLRSAGLVASATAVYVVAEGAYRIARAAGADRRFTGSHERGSFQPSAMPVTQWLNDSVVRIDADSYRLQLRQNGGTRHLDLGELSSFDDELVATLDCTGGWHATQKWEGVSLDRLLDAPGSSIVVTSATGYQRRFPRASAAELLLATRVGEAPLSSGHGFPARLVAPGRRGFWWVKWVVEIAVDNRPWWTQSPFPLT